MKSLIIIFGALLMIVATPFVFSSIDDGITDPYTQSISGVTTGAGEYAENVTLGRAVYNDDDSSVTSISSNISGDTPTASAYNTTSHALEVSGLAASQTRTLTVTFNIDDPSLPTGVSTFLGLMRWFWVFIITGMAGGAVYAFFD